MTYFFFLKRTGKIYNMEIWSSSTYLFSLPRGLPKSGRIGIKQENLKQRKVKTSFLFSKPIRSKLKDGGIKLRSRCFKLIKDLVINK